jgi:hypothetical protein
VRIGAVGLDGGGGRGGHEPDKSMHGEAVARIIFLGWLQRHMGCG